MVFSVSYKYGLKVNVNKKIMINKKKTHNNLFKIDAWILD